MIFLEIIYDNTPYIMAHNGATSKIAYDDKPIMFITYIRMLKMGQSQYFSQNPRFITNPPKNYKIIITY